MKRCLFFIIAAPLSVTAVAKPMLHIERWQTRNGAKVLFVPARSIPLVNINVGFRAGSARDGAHAGIARLTTALLDQGTQTLSANKIAEQFEDVGAEFAAGIDRDVATISLRSLAAKQFLVPAVQTFIDVLGKPAFPVKAVVRGKRLQVAALHQQQQNPQWLASRALFQQVYGKHPYSSPKLGTIISVEGIKPGHIKDFYRRYYVANNMVIAIVGDLTGAAARELAEKISRAVPAGKAAPALPVVQPLVRMQEQHIEYPATQMQIMVGQPSIALNDPDRLALNVANYSFGGGAFVSRLFQEIREQRGLSYGVSSRFLAYDQAGPFIIALATRREKTAEALSVTLKQLREFVNTGPTAQELALAKRHIVGNFPLRLDSNRAIASAILTMGIYNLPDDYFDTYRQRVQAVTLKQIKQALQRHLDPRHLAIITVGKHAKKA